MVEGLYIFKLSENHLENLHTQIDEERENLPVFT